MTRVRTTRAVVAAASSPRPSRSRYGARSGARVEPPYAAEKKPATVTPICTAARKRLGLRATSATRAPRAPLRSIAVSWLSRSETRAISVAAKTPPTRTNSSTSARLSRVWLSIRTVHPRTSSGVDGRDIGADPCASAYGRGDGGAGLRPRPHPHLGSSAGSAGRVVDDVRSGPPIALLSTRAPTSLTTCSIAAGLEVDGQQVVQPHARPCGHLEPALGDDRGVVAVEDVDPAAAQRVAATSSPTL